MSDSYLDEYRELNNHTRECWKYISDLLKNFLFLQIILISLVFLGGGISRIEGIPLTVNPCQGVCTNNKVNPTEEKAIQTVRKIAIMVLVFIGVAGSIGATYQNLRLFSNAKGFIHRAAFVEEKIEEKKEFFEDSRAARHGKTYPPNIFLSEKLFISENKPIDVLKILLATTYLIFLPLWLYFAYTFSTLYF